MKRAAASAVVLFALVHATAARAEDGGSGAASRDAPYMTVGVNPIGLVAGRYSADAVVFVRPTFALVASGHLIATNEYHPGAYSEYDGINAPASHTYDRGYGGELGIRIYEPWHRHDGRTSALFIGASILHGSYTYSDSLDCSDHAQCTPFTTNGIGLDFGITVNYGIFIATMGVGFQYVVQTPHVDMNQCHDDGAIGSCLIPAWQAIVNGDGFRPRLLLTVGVGG